MQRILSVGAAIFLCPAAALFSEDPPHSTAEVKVPPAEALARLEAGNQRFKSGSLQHPDESVERRTQLGKGQAPFAVVLGCADSRVPPELTFDQGLGDLFVIRVAGNIIDDGIVASIEYGVEHLGARLIVVLGHERCGAVTAAKETIAAGGKAPGHLTTLVTAIKPAVDATATVDLDATIKANVLNVVKALETSEPVLKAMVEKKEIVVKGAYYDLDSGAVTFLNPQ